MRDPILQRIVILCAGFNILLSGIYLIFIKTPWPWIKGQLLGGAIAIVLFFQMELTLRKALVRPPRLANRKVRLGYMIRLVIYAVLILLAMQDDSVNLIALLVGIVSMKYTILVSSLFKKRDE